MSNLSSALTQLREERDRLDKAITALESLTDTTPEHNKSAAPKRMMSAAARKRIAVAQRLRWAKWKRQQKAAR